MTGKELIEQIESLLDVKFEKCQYCSATAERIARQQNIHPLAVAVVPDVNASDNIVGWHIRFED